MERGENGARYGTVNEFIEHSFMIRYRLDKKIPVIPNRLALSINNKRYHLRPFIISGSVNNNADSEVMAITIIIIGDTIPASTAALPNIKAPTVDIALVVKFGLLRSLSRNISKEIIIIIASINAGNGTDALWIAKLKSNFWGSIFWL